MKKRAKPKRKPRRVVLGVGHPWFAHHGNSRYASLILWTEQIRAGKCEAQPLPLEFGDLGNWNKIRLVAEVLK